MRRKDRNAGSIKAFLILALLAANIALALPRRGVSARSPGSVGVLAKNSSAAQTSLPVRMRGPHDSLDLFRP